MLMKLTAGKPEGRKRLNVSDVGVFNCKLFHSGCSCSQFHQHFTRKFFVRKCFSLVTFWRKKHFRTKNADVKC
jgi:hypothetical protein